MSFFFAYAFKRKTILKKNLFKTLNLIIAPLSFLQMLLISLFYYRMVVMSNINGQLTPVLQQNATQQILTNANEKLKAQQQHVILQQVI